MLSTPAKNTAKKFRPVRLALDLVCAAAMGFLAYTGLALDVTSSEETVRADIQELNMPALVLSTRLDETVHRILEKDTLSAQDAKDITALETDIDALPNHENSQADGYIYTSDMYDITGAVTTFASETFENDYVREVEKRDILTKLDTYRTDEPKQLESIVDDRLNNDALLWFILKAFSIVGPIVGWVLLRRPKEFFEA